MSGQREGSCEAWVRVWPLVGIGVLLEARDRAQSEARVGGWSGIKIRAQSVAGIGTACNWDQNSSMTRIRARPGATVKAYFGARMKIQPLIRVKIHQ